MKDIMTSKAGRSEKIEKVVTMGIPYGDALTLYRMYNKSPRREKGETFTYGVEIECFLNRAAVCEGLARKGVAYEWQGRYCHTNGNTDYKFKRDGSITRSRGITAGHEGIECVSPVLKSSDRFRSLRKVCDTLLESGAQVNRSTGLHVHIGCTHLSERHLLNIYNNYHFLTLVFEKLFSPSRLHNNYARRLPAGVCACRSHEELDRCLGNDRYWAVNPVAYYQHGTIEFRQHQGTVNFEKIRMWVTILIKLVTWSKDHRMDSYPASAAEVDFLSAGEREYIERRSREIRSLDRQTA